MHTALFTSSHFSNKSQIENGPEKGKYGGKYGDNLEELDWSIGEIFRSLITNNLINNTMIIFTSDNGPFLEERSEGGSNGGLKGGKGQNWEGGVRVPFFVYFPYIEKPFVVSSPVSLMDIFPTLIELSSDHQIDDQIDDRIPDDHIIDGRSLLPLLFPPSNRFSFIIIFIYLFIIIIIIIIIFYFLFIYYFFFNFFFYFNE